ncbi:MAG: DUF983 domain-containing protein [Proteobacteria bacterium]|jgi:uncharacterized protein (DUF983 family)|nr:DUF983 domain-containing protein [Pseudomonadota bacterium]
MSERILLDIINRKIKPALLNGWKMRCPACGVGLLFSSYLKVRENCSNCNVYFRHHRADDGPAYLTILVVGHLIAPALLWIFTHYSPNPLIVASTFSTASVGLSLYLLPRLKGSIIGIQWAKKMHGFGSDIG